MGSLRYTLYFDNAVEIYGMHISDISSKWKALRMLKCALILSHNVQDFGMLYLVVIGFSKFFQKRLINRKLRSALVTTKFSPDA